MKTVTANRDSVVVVAKVATARAVERDAAKAVATPARKAHAKPNRVRRTAARRAQTLNQPGLHARRASPSRVRKPNLLRKQQSWLMRHATQVAKKNVSRGVVVDAAIAARVMPARKPKAALEKVLKMQRSKGVQATHLPRSRERLKLLAHPGSRPHPLSRLSSWKLRTRQARRPRQPIQPICNRLKPRARLSVRLKPANRGARVAVAAPLPSQKPKRSA